MQKYTPEQIEEAIDSLPLEVQQMLFHPNTEYEVGRIGTEAGLATDQIKTLSVLANFILMGLLDEKYFGFEIKNDLNISEVQAKEVAEKILKEVINPIIEFKEKIILKEKEEEEARILEEAEYAEIMKEKEVETLLGQKKDAKGSEGEKEIPPAKTLEKMPDIAPDNLPTGEEVENLVMPNLTPKPAPEENIGGKEEAHPFEEKMKKVFTGTGAAIGDLAIETPIERKNSVSNDPYREPIE